MHATVVIFQPQFFARFFLAVDWLFLSCREILKLISIYSWRGRTAVVGTKGKRWDYDSRLSDLEKLVANATAAAADNSSHDTAMARINQLEQEKTFAAEQIMALQQSLEAAQTRYTTEIMAIERQLESRQAQVLSQQEAARQQADIFKVKKHASSKHAWSLALLL